MVDKRIPSDLNDSELDALFGAARDAAPVPSEALTARIYADADAALPPDQVPGTGRRRRGWFGRALDGIGGWPAAAGLAAAAVTGIAIGVVTPETLDSLSNGYLSLTETSSDLFLPSYTALLGEG